LDEEKQKKEANAPDRAMRQAWRDLHEAREEFDDTEYTVDDPLERSEARAELFRLFDFAVETSKAYWVEADKIELEIVRILQKITRLDTKALSKQKMELYRIGGCSCTICLR
jgi:hypothetical protein